MGRDFDGTDDQIDCTSIGIGGQAQLTMIVWATETTINANDAFISSGDTLNELCAMTSFANGGDEAIFCDATGDNGGSVDVSGFHSGGDLMCLLYRYDGSESTNATRLRFFTNGTERTLGYYGTVPATLGTTTDTCLLGNGEALDFGATELDGTIYYAMAIEQVYSDAAIAAIARGVHPFSLLGNRLLDMDVWGDASPEVDLSGDGNDGTLTGTTKVAHINLELRENYM